MKMSHLQQSFHLVLEPNPVFHPYMDNLSLLSVRSGD